MSDILSGDDVVGMVGTDVWSHISKTDPLTNGAAKIDENERAVSHVYEITN